MLYFSFSVAFFVSTGVLALPFPASPGESSNGPSSPLLSDPSSLPLYDPTLLSAYHQASKYGQVQQNGVFSPVSPLPASPGKLSNGPTSPLPASPGEWSSGPGSPLPASPGKSSNGPTSPLPASPGESSGGLTSPLPATPGESSSGPTLPLPATPGKSSNVPTSPPPSNLFWPLTLLEAADKQAREYEQVQQNGIFDPTEMLRGSPQIRSGGLNLPLPRRGLSPRPPSNHAQHEQRNEY